jgi:hypothetical protein
MEMNILLHLGSVEVQLSLVLVHLLRLDLSRSLHGPDWWEQRFSLWDLLQWDDFERAVSQVVSKFDLGSFQELFGIWFLHMAWWKYIVSGLAEAAMACSLLVVIVDVNPSISPSTGAANDDV